LLNRPDAIVHICSAQLDSRIQQLVQEFPDRVHLTSLPYEEFDTQKQRFQMICFGNSGSENMIMSHFQKGWRASGSRCLWIIEDTDYATMLKTLIEFLGKKDFVNELSFDIRPAGHWIGQAEK